MKNRAVFSLFLSTGLVAALTAVGCSSAPESARHQHGVDCGTAHTAAAGDDPEIHRLLHTDRPWLPNTPPEGSTDMVPFAACFDSENPPSPETVARVNATIRGTLAKYNVAARWTSTSVNGNNIPAGTPITLRVSFVPDTVNAPDLDGVYAPSSLFASMDAKFGGNRALWISRIQSAFNRWGALTGVTYIFVNAPGVDWDDGAVWSSPGSATRGDVRIAMRPMDGQSGVLAFNSYPINGDMVLDSAESWGSSNNTHRFLRNVVMHEHGHGLGLAHVCPINNSKLMEPTYSSSYDGPQQDDLRGIHFRYGDVNEPNNSSVAATQMGAVNPGQTFTIGTVPAPSISNGSLVSLHINGDSDWYEFEPSAPMMVSATVTPLGTTYDAADQTGSSCPSGSPVNALVQADVAVSVVASNGSSVLGASTLAAAGLAESETFVLVPGGASFFVRVYETGSQTESQMYRLNVTTATIATAFAASDGTHVDGVHLSWSALSGAIEYQVWRSTSTNRASAMPVIETAGTTAVDTEVEPGQVYHYWLRAAQSEGMFVDVAGPNAGSISTCRADMGGPGGVHIADGELNNNDFIVFINCFFLLDSRADFGGQGGLPGGDGQFDNNDFITFINAFFAGC